MVESLKEMEKFVVIVIARTFPNASSAHYKDQFKY